MSQTQCLQITNEPKKVHGTVGNYGLMNKRENAILNGVYRILENKFWLRFEGEH